MSCGLEGEGLACLNDPCFRMGVRSDAVFDEFRDTRGVERGDNEEDRGGRERLCAFDKDFGV